MRRSYCLHFGSFRNRILNEGYNQLEIELLARQQQLDDKNDVFVLPYRKEERRRTVDVAEHFDTEHDVEYHHAFWRWFMSGNQPAWVK